MSAPRALILDFGGVLTTDLWDSVRICARREGLHQEALLDLLRRDPVVHPLFVGLERGDVSQPAFELQLAAAAGISAEGLLGRMCADLRPNRQLLDAIVLSDQTGSRKPERAIYEFMVNLLGIDARDAVFVDDVEDYLRPASELGMTVIHHTDTLRTLAELERLFSENAAGPPNLP